MADIFNVSLPFFSTDDGLRGSQCPELEDCDCENVQLLVNPKVAGFAAPDGCLQIHGASWDSSENPQDAADVFEKPLNDF